MSEADTVEREVSEARARELLDGAKTKGAWCPDVDGNVWCDERKVLVAGEMRIGDDSLAAAAPDLARTVVALHARLAQAERERNEARAQLDALSTDLQRAAKSLAKAIAPHLAAMGPFVFAVGETKATASAAAGEVPHADG